MIVLHCTDPSDESRFTSLIEKTHGHVLAAERWEDVDRHAPEADCSVVAYRRLRADEHVKHLADLKSRYPHSPVVVVTRQRANNVRLISRIPIEEIVWFRQVESALPRAIRRARTTELFQEVWERTGADLTSDLKRALSLAFRTDSAVRSVGDLASEVGCDRRTLWYQWRSATVQNSDLTLQEFLSWLDLLHVLSLKDASRGWQSVASELEVHPQTIRRTARRLTGTSLSSLAAEGRSLAVEKFFEQLEDAGF